ncbi:MAG: hypothetical protein ACRDAM_20885 [Casimicrobium sp.]
MRKKYDSALRITDTSPLNGIERDVAQQLNDIRKFLVTQCGMTIAQ